MNTSGTTGWVTWDVSNTVITDAEDEKDYNVYAETGLDKARLSDSIKLFNHTEASGLGGQAITNQADGYYKWGDADAPEIVDATLYDTNNDGYIDDILIEFSEALNDSSLGTAGQFTFGGTACSSFVSGTEDDEFITLTTDEMTVFGTAVSEVIFSWSDNTFEDAAGNDTASDSDIDEIDLAKPVLVDVYMQDAGTGGVFTEAGDRMDLVFSETLSALPTEPQLEAALTFAGGATDGDNIPDNIESEGTYTLATTTFTNDTIRIISNANTSTTTNPSTPGTTTVEVVTGTNIKDDATTPNEANTDAAAETSIGIVGGEISLHIGDNRV
ncbi:MAG: hypothetical protein KAR31_02330, partial [Candidatus Omnitrophica bacterium]|nr:hypothetical protein [Candidatus Omnitrophota bacterium]